MWIEDETLTLTEQPKKYEYLQNFPLGKWLLLSSFWWSPCNRKDASNFIISFPFISFQWWALELSFRFLTIFGWTDLFLWLLVL
jgi:hypothetical protein